ncbi:MAG: hypothetical protein KF842_09935 [Caulobacter sp.]|nr:hypothetical protein [Caulobacter sp.]
MAGFNISDAALSGFGVIKRNPLAPAVWGLVQMALVAVPLLLILPSMIELFGLAAHAAQTDQEPEISQIMAIQSRMMMVSPLSWLGQLVGTGLVIGAVFRAVLSPGEGRWFFMRFSMAEVMLVAVSIVFKILLAVAILVGVIVVAIAAVALYQASEAAGIIAGVIGGLALVIAAIWGGLRFSLSWPMSFDRKNFLLFESWPLTRGQAGGLFLMGLLNAILVTIIQSVVFGAVFGVVAAAFFGLGGFDFTDETQFLQPERLKALIPWGIGLMVLSGLVSGYLIALMAAPWAAAYKALRPQEVVE